MKISFKQRRVQLFLIIFLLVLSLLTRVLFLDRFPVGVNSDEVTNANVALNIIEKKGFSLLHKDGEEPLYFWLLALYFLFMPVNLVSLRFFQAVLGVITIILTFMLFKKFVGWKTSFLAALLVVFSFWNINSTRVALRGVNVSLSALLFMNFFLRYAFSRKLVWLVLASVSIVFGVYLYSAAWTLAFITPLLFFYVLRRSKKLGLKRRLFLKHVLIFYFVIIILTLPLVFAYLSFEEGLRRANQVVFLQRKDLSFEQKIQLFFSKYLASFVDMLYLKGVVSWQDNIPGKPLLDLFSMLFLPVGLVVLVRRRDLISFLFLIVFLSFPVANAITIDGPHALRANQAIPVIQLISSMGFFSFTGLMKKRGASNNMLILFFLVVFGLSAALEIQRYVEYVHYPSTRFTLLENTLLTTQYVLANANVTFLIKRSNPEFYPGEELPKFIRFFDYEPKVKNYIFYTNLTEDLFERGDVLIINLKESDCVEKGLFGLSYAVFEGWNTYGFIRINEALKRTYKEVVKEC